MKIIIQRIIVDRRGVMRWGGISGRAEPGTDGCRDRGHPAGESAQPLFSESQEPLWDLTEDSSAMIFTFGSGVRKWWRTKFKQEHMKRATLVLQKRDGGLKHSVLRG